MEAPIQKYKFVVVERTGMTRFECRDRHFEELGLIAEGFHIAQHMGESGNHLIAIIPEGFELMREGKNER